MYLHSFSNSSWPYIEKTSPGLISIDLLTDTIEGTVSFEVFFATHLSFYSILILNLCISSFRGEETFGCGYRWPCPWWRVRACNGICCPAIRIRNFLFYFISKNIIRSSVYRHAMHGYQPQLLN